MLFEKFKVGRSMLKPGHPLIMGILNVTPDSFSDGGKFLVPSRAVQRALEMEEEGADIIDVGGESSRPGALPVPEQEELRRIVPVIRGIRKRSGIPISIDTVKPAVAHAAVDEGADMINDITGFSDPGMVRVAARCGKPVVVMHMKGVPRTMQKKPRYRNVTKEVTGFLVRRAKMLEAHGVKKIVLDPGIGFGKTVEDNLALLRGIGNLALHGHPVLVGASRKSFIGAISGGAPEDRLPGSVAVHLWSVLQGVAIVRVHDVAAHRQGLTVAMRIKGEPSAR